MNESIGVLGKWEGYSVASIERFEAGEKGPRAEVWMELEPGPVCRMYCSGCGPRVRQIHDLTERWVRDLSILEAQTRLRRWRCRVASPRCGPTLEPLPWLGRHTRVTTRLAENVGGLIPPVPMTYNGEPVIAPTLLCRFAAKLLGEYSNVDGDRWSSIRKATVEVFEPKMAQPTCGSLASRSRTQTSAVE